MANIDWQEERAKLLDQIEQLKKREKEVEGDTGLEREKQKIQLLKQELELRKALETSRRAEASEQANAGTISAARFEAIKDAANTEIRLLQQKTEGYEKRERQITKEQKALETTNSLVDSIGVRFGLASSGAGSMSKNIFKSYKSLVKTHGVIKGSAKMAHAFVTSIASALHPLNVIESLATAIWKETWELFKRFSESVASMNAAIGDAGATAKAAGKAVHYGLGIEIEEATEAAGGLASSFTAFTSMSTAAKTPLIRMGAALKRVGLSASDTGAGMDLMTKAMGMTSKEGQKQWKALAVSASAYGKTVPQMSADFKSASGVLMAHGPKMMGVFKDLQATAMATGLAMDKLLSVAAKFDTFDSAASAVGNLNALLGGDYLNTLEMMNMTENERIQALKGSLEMAGKNFDQMERFERKAIAEQMGMDEAELAKTMKSSGREARKARRDAKAKEKDQKAYQAMIKSTVDITKSLKMLFTSLFAHTGLMSAFGDAFKELFKQLKPGSPLGKGIREITGFIGDLMASGIKLAIKMFKKWMGSGEELTEKIKKWKDKAKTWFDEWENGSRTIESTIEEVKTKVKAYVVEMLGLGDVFGGEGKEGETLQGKMKTGLKKMVTFIKGPAFDPVRKAFTNLVIMPMSKALSTFAQSMAAQGRAEGGVTGYILGKVGDIAGASATAMVDVAKDLNKKGLGTSIVKGVAPDPKEMEEALNFGMMTPLEEADAWVKQYIDPGSPSKRFLEYGMAIVEGFKAGLSPKGIEKIMERLVEATDEWAESLKEVADQVRDISVATTGKGAAGAAGKSRVVLELDGKVLAEYVIDTVNRKAKQLAIP